MRILLVLATLACAAAAMCDCGYTLNASSSASYALFLEAQETDFLHVKNLSLLDDWRPQAYQQDPEAARGPFGRIFTVQNVIANPLRERYNWGGDGIRGGAPGVQLWVNSTLLPGEDGSVSILCSEIVTSRRDILYGSFRIGMKTSAISGTCSAFFYYRDDTSEIDMEFLSKQQTPGNSSVNLVIQSPQNGGLGYTAPGSVNFDHQALEDSPSSQYIEYRFDWLPDRVDFYANSKLLKTMTENVPQSPGSIHLSHWSNGNTGWSGGPPAANAVMTVSYVKAYFNSSGPTAFSNNCTNAIRDTCIIPDVTASPDPQQAGGNFTGHTPFLTNSTTGNSSSETSGVGEAFTPVGGAVRYCMVMAIAVMIMF